MNESDIALWVFREQEKHEPRYTGFQAMVAIRAFAKEAKPIPSVLIPWVNEACNAWISEHRSQVKPIITRQKWEPAVAEVHLLWKSGTVTNQDKAIEIVAEKYFTTFDYLAGKYRSAKYKGTKMAIDMIDWGTKG